MDVTGSPTAQLLNNFAGISQNSREPQSPFYSAALLKCHAPHASFITDTPPHHVILTLSQPVLALPQHVKMQLLFLK